MEQKPEEPGFFERVALVDRQSNDRSSLGAGVARFGFTPALGCIMKIVMLRIRGFWTIRKLIVAGVTATALSATLLYLTYTPDYESFVRAEILWQLNRTEGNTPPGSRLSHPARWDLSGDSANALRGFLE